jgi:elongation factor Ts
LVKELREKTGVGMMDCKTALTETNGDFEAAVDWLRAKGLAKAAKKAGRIAAEGLIGVATDGKSGAVVEVNSETDFVARNADFQRSVYDISKLALKANGDIEALQGAKYPGKGQPVSEFLKELVATIGENISLRRTAHLKVKEGVVVSYVHSQVDAGLGKIGVLVALESKAAADKLSDIGRKVAMHIAATNPIALTPAEVPKDVLDRERAVFAEQARESGKPANIIEKMVEGRVKKFYQESVLMQQAFVLDPDSTVEQAVKAAEKDVGAPIAVRGFVRFALGEGIQKKEDDFAAEVAAAAGVKKPEPAAKAEAPAAEKKSAAKPATQDKAKKSEPAAAKAAKKPEPKAKAEVAPKVAPKVAKKDDAKGKPPAADAKKGAKKK